MLTRKRSGNLVLSIDTQVIETWVYLIIKRSVFTLTPLLQSLFAPLPQLKATLPFWAALIGLGLGVGLSVSIASLSLPISAAPDFFIEETGGIKISRITIPSLNFDTYLQDEVKAPLGNAHLLPNSGLLGQHRSVLIELKDVLLDKINLGDEIKVSGANNGLYTFTVIEIRVSSSNDLKELTLLPNAKLILVNEQGFLSPTYHYVIAR